MRLRIFNRTEDAGSAGCPPQSVSCNTDPDGHDLTPSQSTSVAANNDHSTALVSTSTSVIDASITPHGSHALNPQALAGILIIIALVLAFALGGAAVICGLRGERCCCRRRRKKREKQKEKQVEGSPCIQVIKEIAE
ncbi:hypothetical protein DFH11DRAFT_1730120 [Phellopilus nigrolimitatus]|nr:hypothetical protein DFH11DRAFT_1730120 [Phellopilus nigrolimitatus]